MGLLDFVKVVAVALITCYPFYEVVSTLTRYVDSLEQCTDQPCNYVRIYEGQHIPGTGTRVISVQNGVERPIYLQPQWVGWEGWNFSAVSSINFTKSINDNLHHHNLDAAFGGTMYKAMSNATSRLPKVGPFTTVALSVCTLVQRALTIPVFFLVDKVIPDNFVRGRGDNPLQRIPSAFSATNGTVEETCSKEEVMRNIGNFMNSGPSKVIYMIALAGWALMIIIHDFLLISQKPQDADLEKEHEDVGPLREEWAILVGCASVFFQTVATAACFSWSSGALSIFAAVVDDHETTVVCFYRLPYLQAFFALSTPMVLLFLLMGHMQSLALAMIYGDYLYTDRYRVPFKMVYKAYSWRTGSSLLHDVESPSRSSRDAEKRPLMSSEESSTIDVPPHYWKRKYLVILDLWFLVMLASVISIAGFGITVRAGEFATETMRDRTTQGRLLPWVVTLLLVMPSCIFVLIAILQVFELFHHCCWHKEKVLRVADCLRPGVIIICWAAGFGLWPGELLTHPPEIVSLYQAELWGNGGVVLFLFGISFVRTNFFSIREALHALEVQCKECSGPVMRMKYSTRECSKCNRAIIGDGQHYSCAHCDNHRLCTECKASAAPEKRVHCSLQWHHDLVSLEVFEDRRNRQVMAWVRRSLKALGCPLGGQEASQPSTNGSLE